MKLSRYGLILLAALVATILVAVVTTLQAETVCPTDKPCKVIVVTAEQENMLDQIITNTCIQGPYAQVSEVVKFYKDMLAKAPAGVPAKPAPKK